jgi:hypothetical protein
MKHSTERILTTHGGARRRRSKLRQRRRAAGTLGLYRRRPSGVHGQQILAVARDHF